MNVKKLRLIKFNTSGEISFQIFWNLILVVIFEIFLSYIFLTAASHLGFICGLLSFSSSFLLMNIVAQRVLVLGDIRRGVNGSFLAVIAKFLVPFSLVWYSVFRGFDLVFVFLGLVLGLVNVSVLLYKLSVGSAKNH